MHIRVILNLSADKTDKKLRDPHGSLCKEVPLSSIERANLALHQSNQVPVRISMYTWIHGFEVQMGT